jgi:hypothetical protein
VPDAAPIAPEVGTRTARFTDKTGWRGKSPKSADAEADVAPEVASTEDHADEEALIPAPNDEVVLEEEPDEGDISGLVDHHEPDDPKER